MKRRLAVLAITFSLFAAVAATSATPALASGCASAFTHYGAYSTPYGTLWSSLELQVVNGYPNCQYNFVLRDYFYDNNGVQRAIDVEPIQLRWWVCGAGRGAGFYGVVNGTAAQQSGWWNFGTCAPSADNGGNRESPAGVNYFRNPYVSF